MNRHRMLLGVFSSVAVIAATAGTGVAVASTPQIATSAQVSYLAASPNGDADHDGLTNRAEYKLGTNAHKQDTDNDGMDDGDEVRDGRTSTDVLKRDTNRNGVLDGDEDADHNGVDNEDEDDSVETCIADDRDSDEDGVDNEDENDFGTSANDSDSDDDRVSDGLEDDDEDGVSNQHEDDDSNDECESADDNETDD